MSRIDDIDDRPTVQAEETTESRWEAGPAVLVVIGLQLTLAVVSRELDWKLWYLPWWVWMMAVGPEAVLLVALLGSLIAVRKTAAASCC
jgi:hypothetical protein